MYIEMGLPFEVNVQWRNQPVKSAALSLCPVLAGPRVWIKIFYYRYKTRKVCLLCCCHALSSLASNLPLIPFVLCQMVSQCSLSKECCTTQYREPGAGLTALPSTTPSTPSKRETIPGRTRLTEAAPTRRSTLQPHTAEPDGWSQKTDQMH